MRQLKVCHKNEMITRCITRISTVAVELEILCPNAVKPNKQKHQSLEQRMVSCKGKARSMSGSCAKGTNSFMVFREEFL